MSAQQNLFVAQDLESAIVNKDNTVTFNFKAPDAQKVQIAGDFAEKAEGQHIGGMVGAGLIDMTKNSEGIWSCYDGGGYACLPCESSYGVGAENGRYTPKSRRLSDETHSG